MGLLDKTYKGNISSTSQAIADKYLQIIFGNYMKLNKVFDMELDEDKLYIRRYKGIFLIPIRTSILNDMYNDIGRDFTIITDSKIVIEVDSNIDILEHIKIESDDHCKIHIPTSTNDEDMPEIELKKLDVKAKSLAIDLPGVKLSNVNIKVTDNIDFIYVQGMELFKNISGNMSANYLSLYIWKSPLTESLYTETMHNADNIYKHVVDTNFIDILKPDKFDIDTYHISNWQYFSFYITKHLNYYVDSRYINDKWAFTYC